MALPVNEIGGELTAPVFAAFGAARGASAKLLITQDISVTDSFL